MNEVFDVAIVGAGPAGISAACILADAGRKLVDSPLHADYIAHRRASPIR